MKILSQYKDYYDYLIGVYGVDDKIVLDRRNNQQYKFIGKSIQTGKIYFCNKVVDFVYDDGKFYYLDEIIKKYGTPEKKLWYDRNDNYTVVYIKGSHFHNDYVRIDIRDTDINIKENCPIILEIYGGDYWNYPKLSDLNFSKVYNPHDAFMMLTEWLSPKDKDINPLTDKEKIITNGFDIVTSFRNIK